MSTTTNYGWTKPDPGGSNGVWGTILNTDLDSIDTTVFAVSEAADDAQAAADNAQDTADEALAGGSAITPVAVVLAGGDPYTGTIDLDTGSLFIITQTTTFTSTDVNLTFSNRPATKGKMVYLHLILTASSGLGNRTVSVKNISAQSQWVLPWNQEVSTGAQILASITVPVSTTRTYVLPLYIVAGV